MFKKLLLSVALASAVLPTYASEVSLTDEQVAETVQAVKEVEQVAEVLLNNEEVQKDVLDAIQNLPAEQKEQIQEALALDCNVLGSFGSSSKKERILYFLAGTAVGVTLTLIVQKYVLPKLQASRPASEERA